MPRPTKETKDKILIVVEGRKSEYYYFEGMRHDGLFPKISIEVKHVGTRTSAPQIVNRAILEKGKSDYAQCWAVFDKDNNTDDQLLQAFREARENNIQVAFSSLCFEVWILAHYTDSGLKCMASDDAIAKINKHMPKYTKVYEYAYVESKAHLAKASKRAEQMRKNLTEALHHQNPYLDIDLLIKEIVSI